MENNPKIPWAAKAVKMPIIEFFECPWLLNIKNLSAAQRIALKAIRAEPLDTKIPIIVQHPYQIKGFSSETDMFSFFSGKTEYKQEHYSDVSLCWGRRCLEENTDILTPKGPVAIKDINVGDEVYGYNKDGSVSITYVIRKFDNGPQEVRALTHSNKILVESTENHQWYTTLRRQERNGSIRYISSEKEVKQFKDKDQFIERSLVKIPCGDIKEPHAYVLGAFLGDGCCKQGSSRCIDISSSTDAIPNKIKEILKADQIRRNHETNYTWHIFKDNIQKETHYYEQWLHDKYAHEKFADLDIIKTWDRESCLQFMAGLLDTDGSVYLSPDTQNFTINFGCQAKKVVEAFQYLFYKLWQHKLSIHTDNRSKYKNGPIHYIKCKSNFYAKIALRELDPYLVTPSKKWKPEYSDFLEQRIESRIGVIVSDKRVAQTYDVEVANETNLYLLANEGLITKNSGKSTTIGAGLAIYYGTQFDFTPYLGTSPHATIPIISPSKEQAGEVYAAIKTFFLRSPYLFQEYLNGDVERFQDEYDEDSMDKKRIKGGQIALNNRVIIKVMAADISKIRGMAVPFAILDENCFFGTEGNDNKNTDKSIYEALAPALSQFQQIPGMALILKISSPNGQSGLMYDDFENQTDEDVLHLQIPTWYANPTISVNYLKKQEKKGRSYFNREYGAQYTASESSYLDPELIDAAIIKGAEELDPMSDYRYVAAMDYATKEDYWFFAIGHKEYHTDNETKEKFERVYIDFLAWWRGKAGEELDPTKVIPEICAYMHRYKVAHCISDQYAFAALRPMFQKHGCILKEFKVTNASKLKYFYSLQIAINSGTLKMVHNPVAVKHLKDLREKKSNVSGRIKVEHASNCHDDGADAIALCLYQFDKTSPIYVGWNKHEEEKTVQTKDLTGKFVAMPTAEELAEANGVGKFYDNRNEHEAKENQKEDQEDKSSFWFIF